LVLKTGDKVVLRDTRGSIHILTITTAGAEELERANLSRVPLEGANLSGA